MSRLSSSEWRTARRILLLLQDSPGLGEADLAKRADVPPAMLRRPLGMLLGRGLVQRCDSYICLAAKPQGGDQS